ncbi:MULTISPECIES: response regulator transcription factor [unclassified Chromobacterium]|uniref:response regulator transcription factor n=1 Tax=unclassified Chromobacterium TaxID=2641838 RepID=UPI0018EE8CEC|nr:MULTISPECIES: response regulator transcription factor [unclassified Chromobacterium]MCP1293271.1 response regulator transcription factor [Chromobacterium sp. S0633]
MMIVAILEDCPLQTASVVKLLEQYGHQAVACADGDQFVAQFRQQRCDAMLLDWEVPGRNGVEVLKWARAKLPPALPILMVTQRDDEEDIVLALEHGADDYLQKPIRERELLARLNAQFRKQQRLGNPEASFEAGGYTFHPEARSVSLPGGKAATLPAREFALATLLFRNLGRILTKDFLSQRIWGQADRKYDASLATYVSNLRSALGLRPRNGMVISTVYNYGYRLERV